MQIFLALAVLTLWAPVAEQASAQAVDYHKAQQAGKVWERKQGDRARQQSRQRNQKANSEGVAYGAPLTASDLERARRANRQDYERLMRSVGQKNAEKWLEFKARKERSLR